MKLFLILREWWRWRKARRTVVEHMRGLTDESGQPLFKSVDYGYDCKPNAFARSLNTKDFGV